MFDRYSHPMMYVVDLGRAVTWYENTLGFKTQFHIPNNYASLYHEKMNLRLDLHPSEANSKDIGFGCLNYFSSRQFDQTLEDLKKKNVKVGTPRQEQNSPRFVTFWDSEGNALGMIEETP